MCMSSTSKDMDLVMECPSMCSGVHTLSRLPLSRMSRHTLSRLTLSRMCSGVHITNFRQAIVLLCIVNKTREPFFISMSKYGIRFEIAVQACAHSISHLTSCDWCFIIDELSCMSCPYQRRNSSRRVKSTRHWTQMNRRRLPGTDADEWRTAS
jgi:hypothetical protein